MTLFDLPGDEDPAGAAPAGPLRRVVLRVSYDGTDFHGFAPQPRSRTVGGELAGALARMARAPVEIVCAGRTDTGVHAAGQVVHADLPEELVSGPGRGRRAGRRAGGSDGGEAAGAGDAGSGGELAWLARALTSQLGPEVAVTCAFVAPEGFHARHSATSRRYRYQVLNTPAPDPLRARTSWHVPEPLDLAAMRTASDVLLGEHDFAAFCRRPQGAEPGTALRRRVLDAGWSAPGEPPGMLRFEIEANAFCHQMVRSLVGALVAAGEGRLDAARILALLRSGERAGRLRLAPAAGLCLVAVSYAPAGLAFGAGDA